MFTIPRFLAIAAIGAALMAAPAQAQRGHVTGVGGVFIKSADPKALMVWYRDVLGIKIETWGGAMLPYDAPDHPPVLTLNAFSKKSDYFAPSAREIMLNFAVDDMDAILARIEAKGVKIIKRDDSDPSGRFAWLLDPDGTKIELWQPKPEPTTK